MTRFDEENLKEIKSKVKAAIYVRMSTEHQQYSTENQADAISKYAEQHDMEIVKTYADEGKSGLKIEGREVDVLPDGRRVGLPVHGGLGRPIHGAPRGVVATLDALDDRIRRIWHRHSGRLLGE